MNVSMLEDKLFSMSEYEQQYSGTPENPRSYSHLDSSKLVLFNNEEPLDIVPADYFFEPAQNIVFFKHPRYINFRAHSHSFIELNYVYSGTCTQYINGEKVVLQEGDFCLLDTNVVHAIDMASENDIIINILIRNSYFDAAFLQRLSGNDLLTDFFIKAIYQNKKKSQHIVFQSSQNDRLKTLIQFALCDYFDSQLCSEEALNSYMILIFTELLRVYNKSPRQDHVSTLKKMVVSDILSYMETNYKTMTLEQTAETFHFHPNSLTRLLKTNVGKTFMELSHQLKIKNACLLLENTDSAISQIAEEVGYANTSFFYKTFQRIHDLTPAAYRKLKQHVNLD